MLTMLKAKISRYVQEQSELGSWKSIRKHYFYYTYLAFLVLAVKELEPSGKKTDIAGTALSFKIEEPVILGRILKTPLAEQFMQEVQDEIPESEHYETNLLYQEYLAADFTVLDGAFAFSAGKDSRDVLGSYYTQEEFAYEITRKAAGDVCGKGQNPIEQISVIDPSCGGGEFLIAALRCLKCRDVSAIHGYDVDPIAVMITRMRIAKEAGCKPCNAVIKLGNPLIVSTQEENLEKRLEMAAEGRFYHESMGVSETDRYDLVLGNPPWEKLRFEEKKFLAHYVKKEVCRTKKDREKFLAQISKENKTFYEEIAMDYRNLKKRLKMEDGFPGTNCGELNTYALFTELSLKLLNAHGVAGIIVKSSLVKMPVYQSFFKDLTEKKRLTELYMFHNRKKIFQIDSREQFSVLFMRKDNDHEMKVALDLDDYRNLGNAEMMEFSSAMLNRLNPETGMMPNLSNGGEAEFLMTVYQRNPLFAQVYPDCRFGRLVHLTNHSEYIVRNPRQGYEPIYEGKFIEMYTARYATFGGMEEEEKYKNKAYARLMRQEEGADGPESRFFISQDIWKNLSKNFKEGYVIAWRSLTSATNRRTMLARALPLVPTCQSLQLLQLSDNRRMLHVLAVFNSIVFDYMVRLKMAGLDLTQTILRQIPVPQEMRYEEQMEFKGVEGTIELHLNSRIAKLYEKDKRMDALFEAVDLYPLAGNRERKEIIAELDLLVARLYGIGKAQLHRIAASFDKYYSEEELERWF